jgi:DNA repair protein RecO (recombination protein O)
MPDASALDDAFRLTGYFLERHVFGPRGQELPETRDSFMRACRAAMSRPAEQGDIT